MRAGNVQYLVVFSDFTPADEQERIILSLYADGRIPESEIRNGDKAARIYKLSR